MLLHFKQREKHELHSSKDTMVQTNFLHNKLKRNIFSKEVVVFDSASFSIC